MRITRAANKQKGRLPRKPPNINIISHLKTSVNPRFLQTFLFSFMEHPILKNGGSRVIIKAQQRSESNVLSKLTPIKTEESRGYVNAGTQQLLKPLTMDVRGFLFGFSAWKDQPRVTTSLPRRFAPRNDSGRRRLVLLFFLRRGRRIFPPRLPAGRAKLLLPGRSCQKSGPKGPFF